MTDPARPAPVVREFRPEDRAGVLALWGRHFGRWSERRLVERWAWQFDGNPWRRERAPVILVAAAGDRVVGHISGIPVPMRLGGRDEIVLGASGLVVDESHRWAALLLIRSLTRRGPVLAASMRDAVRRTFEHLGARPVPLSTARFTLPRRTRSRFVAGIRNRLPSPLARLAPPRLLAPLSRVHRFRDAPPPRPLPPACGTPVADLGRFDAEYEALWRRARSRWACSMNKDSAYMNWRYADLPGQHAIRLGVQGEAGLTAAAVGVIRANEDVHGVPIATWGELTELVADDPGSPAAGALLAELARRFDRLGLDAVCATGLEGALHGALRAAGFVESRDAIHEALLLDADAASLCAADVVWSYSAGDGDSLYSTVL